MSSSFLKLNSVWIEQLHELHLLVQEIGYEAIIFYAYYVSVEMGFDEQENEAEFDESLRYHMAVYLLWAENPHSKKIKLKKINNLKNQLKDDANKDENPYCLYADSLYDLHEQDDTPKIGIPYL